MACLRGLTAGRGYRATQGFSVGLGDAETASRVWGGSEQEMADPSSAGPCLCGLRHAAVVQSPGSWFHRLLAGSCSLEGLVPVGVQGAAFRSPVHQPREGLGARETGREWGTAERFPGAELNPASVSRGLPGSPWGLWGWQPFDS